MMMIMTILTCAQKLSYGTTAQCSTLVQKICT